MALAQWTDDQIFNQLDSGLKWSGSTITYAFATSAAGMYGGGSDFSMLGSAAQASAKLALALWDDLVSPDMQQVTGTTSYSSANIEFGMSTSVGYGYTWFPSVGSVWFNPSYSSGANGLTDPIIGRHGFYAYVHEIGHALGLEHMGSYDGSGNWQPSSYQDSTVYSVMSYFGPNWSAGSGQVAWADWIGSDGVLYSPQTPMISDIYAIQRIYGAETSTRVGDTVYGFNSNITDVTAQIYDFAQNAHPVLAIFDSAGIDTLDFSGWSTPSLINLAPGSFSSCNAMTNNISIAYSCDVENAVGGGGADTLWGNALNNRLSGGAGDDVLDGLGGNDTLVGGLGHDTVDGGAGTDYVVLGDSWSNLSYALDTTSGYLTIGSALNGTDKIRNVEYFVDKNNVVKSYSDLTGVPVTNPPAPAPAPTPASVAIAANAASIAEGTGGTTTYRFTVTLAKVSSETEKVNWSIAFASGSGQADANDFSGPTAGTLSFAAGQTSATIDLAVAGDGTVEADEAFRIVLANPSSGLVLGTSSAAGLILNDDKPVTTPTPAPAPAPAPEPETSVPGSTFAGTDAKNSLAGGAGDDTLLGMGGNDTLDGGAGNDLLDGGTGSDVMTGGAGDDVYIVDTPRDSINESLGGGIDTVRTALIKYTLTSDVERLEFTGSGGFRGYGNGLDNTIIGGSGSDMLNGGDGNDTLVGGDGADRFVFDTAPGDGNVDFIRDFDIAEDKILLDNAIFRGLKRNGALPADAFQLGGHATDGNDRILYDSGTGALYYDPDGSGRADAIHFATLDPGLALTQLNFQVI